MIFFKSPLTEDLQNKKIALTGQPSPEIPYIHYVSPSGDLSIIKRKFKLVFSRHTIECQVDLINHLQLIGRILEPNGVYVLAVPDHRYCFDHFLSPSNIGMVLDKYLTKSDSCNLQPFIEHRVLTTHNDPIRHWRKDHGTPFTAIARDIIRLKAGPEEWYQNEDSQTHSNIYTWQFTPESFGILIRALFALEMIPLFPIRIYHTLRNRCEFMVILENIKTQLNSL